MRDFKGVSSGWSHNRDHYHFRRELPGVPFESKRRGTVLGDWAVGAALAAVFIFGVVLGVI